YNPHSIAQAILRLLDATPYTEKELTLHNELYHSFGHHGSFSKSTVSETLQNINDSLAKASADLKQANVLFLTFGTSHVFSLNENGETLSQCHPLPATQINRQLTNPSEIITVLENALQQLQKVNKQ